MKILDFWLSSLRGSTLGHCIIKMLQSSGKIVPLSTWAHWPCWCHHHFGCVCVCAYNEADSSRVGITGQSSLYAVCWAPRQKHCWAVKHSVTKTTCSRVEDGQTQTASAAPHQDLVPYHQGLKELLFDSSATLLFSTEHFICIRKLQSRTDCPLTTMLQEDGDRCLRDVEKKEHIYLVWHIWVGRNISFADDYLFEFPLIAL